MKETMVETEVTYTLEHAGRFCIVEHVPARVCKETGEQFFSPGTVEHIQAILKGKQEPTRVVEAPGARDRRCATACRQASSVSSGKALLLRSRGTPHMPQHPKPGHLLPWKVK